MRLTRSGVLFGYGFFAAATESGGIGLCEAVADLVLPDLAWRMPVVAVTQRLEHPAHFD